MGGSTSTKGSKNRCHPENRITLANSYPHFRASRSTASRSMVMFAQSKPVFDYTNVIDDYKTRVQATKAIAGS